jgi:hypothetical protein
VTIVFNPVVHATSENERIGSRLQTESPGAWQREMERAQAATWFHGAIVPAVGIEQVSVRAAPMRGDGTGTGTGTGTGNEVMRLGHAEPSIPAVRSPEAVPLRHASELGVAVPDFPPARVLLHMHASATGFPEAPSTLTSDPAFATPMGRSGGTSLRVDERASLVAAPHEADSLRDASSDRNRPHVRVHVEQGRSGLSVWLGLDGESSDRAGIASLVADLRRNMEAAHRPLALVVCNGKTVYARDARPSVGEPKADPAHPKDHQEG